MALGEANPYKGDRPLAAPTDPAAVGGSGDNSDSPILPPQADGGAEEKSLRKSRWLRATIDNKPWWSIVLVAALGALGTGIISAFPYIVSGVTSLFPSYYNIYILLKDEATRNRIDGAAVSILDMENQENVHVYGTSDNYVVRTIDGV